jgi:CBS-domain-containing membrane protein
MNAADVMTRDVVTVSPDDVVQDVAKLLLKHRISGVPVVDKLGKLVGIVSEGDLMRRAETETDAHRSWWLRLFSASEVLANEYVRSHARKVSDIMTTRVLVAAPDTSLRDIASLMERNRVKRLPIVEGGRLVGIVSRANLMQAFASFMALEPAGDKSDDQSLRERVLDRLRAERWSSPSLVNVIVQQGVVELWGAVDSEAKHKAVRITAEGTPGVASIKDHLVVMQVSSAI